MTDPAISPAPRRSRKVDPDAPAARIADKFGGLSRFARAFDPPKATSTVFRWLETGLIPAQQQAEVLRAAKRAKVRLSAADFIDRREQAA